LWFICQYIKLVDKKDIDPVDYGFVINKSVIYNIQELCQNLVMMQPFMSLETAVANNPYVDDAKSEIEQMKKEKQSELDAYGGSVRNQNEEEEEEGEDDEETSETEEG
jgi:hypothetical protein